MAAQQHSSELAGDRLTALGAVHCSYPLLSHSDLVELHPMSLLFCTHLTVQEQCPDAIAVLVANKTDRISERAVQTAEGAAFASANDMMFFEVSAKSGANVSALFTALAEKLVEQSRDANRGITGMGHTAYG